MTENEDQSGEEPIRLRGAQRDIRDAYFGHNSGLFTLACVAGAGKSTTAYRIAAEDILRRYVDGDYTPEQHVAVLSFNSDEAAEIVPNVCEQLRTIVRHDLSPVASEVSEAEVEMLVQRLQQAPFMGTIDSLLRGVLREFAHDVGFDEMPSIGNEALLNRVNAECYERLETDPSLAGRLAALESAYPSGDYDDGVADMLESAVTYCRDRQLSTSAFREKLEQTRDAVYEDEPKSFDDIVAAVERMVGDDDIEDVVRTEIDQGDQERLVTADRTLYAEWCARIDDFCALLSAYRETYRELTREYGVLSHTDVASLVASYLDGTLSDSAPVESIDAARRRRVLQRYHGRLESLIIDEAQDVSKVQHAALSQLVRPNTRVFACGDVFQSIYRWRHADPTLFQSATADGEYLGIDWRTHCNETATTTHRCVPAVAGAINSISEPLFSDPARGDIGDLQTTFSPLEAAREETAGTSVHVSSFSSNHRPGSPEWANPDGAKGEANLLAKHIKQGLADGTFRDQDGDPLGITVLFRKGTRMGEYESAFDSEDLRVRTASGDLFDDPAVDAVFEVCDWLVDPGCSVRTRQLVNAGDLGLASLDTAFETHSWNLGAVLAEADDISESQRKTLTGLQRLRERRDVVEMQSASAYLEDVIEMLALRAASNKRFPGVDAEQRVANLDALVETVAQWEGDERYGPKELLDLVAPFRNSPSDGPMQPDISGSNYDVEFSTVHRAKGDEDDVVAIADPGFDMWSQGPQSERFVTQGPIAGLAPPTDTEVPTDIDIPPFAGGLYNPDTGRTRDIGLRWATGRWRDTVADTTDADGLVGPDRLQQVVSNERAEAWRLLYVALTRARDHLVLPLPQSLPSGSYRDRWLESLRDGISFDGGTKSYTASTPTDQINIGVNDVEPFAKRERTSQSSISPSVAVKPIRRDRLESWVPRFVNPSTLYPLTEDPDEFALAHLLDESLHTEANNVSDELPLEFDELGPEEVGLEVHEILTALVDHGVSENELRSMDTVVRETFEETLDDRISDGERDGLWSFLDDVVDDFLASDLWDSIQRAESVSVEKPVDGLVEVAGVEVEVHGEADFVVDLPCGDRRVTDAKITLTEQTAETKRRYELQVAAYVYLFEQQGESTESIEPAVETFGVESDTVMSVWPNEITERRIGELLD